MTALQQARCCAYALELIEKWNFPEADALVLAWLHERERPEPSYQLPLLATQETNGR